MRRVILLGVLTLAHFGLTIGSTIYAFGAGMSRFDEGGNPTLPERLVNSIATVLAFPLVWGVAEFVPSPYWPSGFPFDHLVFLANSVLWVACGAWVWSRARRRGRSTSPGTS